MNLELRSVKHMKSLSQETPAYTARLFLDGRPVALVENHGCGGPDNVYWTDQAARAPIEDYLKGLPKIEACGMALEQDLELWCHMTLEDIETVKRVKRTLAKKVIGVTPDGRELAFTKIAPAALYANPTIRQTIEERHPGIVLLNGLSDAEILSTMKRLCA